MIVRADDEEARSEASLEAKRHPLGISSENIPIPICKEGKAPPSRRPFKLMMAVNNTSRIRRMSLYVSMM